MKKLLLLLVLSIAASAQTYAQSECAERGLFSMMPGHEENYCQIREFDVHEFRNSTADGYETLKKEGEKIETWYNWQGEWEKRPSKQQIYKNYQAAIEKQGGKLMFSGSSAYFSLKKSGNNYFIEVNTDGSGMYTVVTLKEADMRQDVVYTANEIQKNITSDGQVTFYGIYFDVNQSTVKSESAPTLKEIAAYLKANTNKQVYIVGHTDNTGQHESNMKLSMARSEAVVNELVSAYGVSREQLIAAGVGDLSPVSSNLTEEGRAKTGV